MLLIFRPRSVLTDEQANTFENPAVQYGHRSLRWVLMNRSRRG